jgi:hypothetical protein
VRGGWGRESKCRRGVDRCAGEEKARLAEGGRKDVEDDAPITSLVMFPRRSVPKHNLELSTTEKNAVNNHMP